MMWTDDTAMKWLCDCVGAGLVLFVVLYMIGMMSTFGKR